jgi:alpha-glucosidase
VVIARRKGSRWFMGALTDRNPRDISVKLDFLKKGYRKLKLWHDAPDSDTNGERLVIEQRVVTASDGLTLHLAPAGGAVACFEPVSQ